MRTTVLLFTVYYAAVAAMWRLSRPGEPLPEPDIMDVGPDTYDEIMLSRQLWDSVGEAFRGGRYAIPLMIVGTVVFVIPSMTVIAFLAFTLLVCGIWLVYQEIMASPGVDRHADQPERNEKR